MENIAPIKDFKFFFGGSATFTVDNGKGKHYTFKVRKKEANERFQNEVFFISVLYGPDNENSYRYMGILRRDGDIKLTKGSKIGPTDIRLKVAQWAINVVKCCKTLPEGYRLVHSGRCCVCGRKLTTVESVEAGVGPKCAENY